MGGKRRHSAGQYWRRGEQLIWLYSEAGHGRWRARDIYGSAILMVSEAELADSWERWDIDDEARG